MANILYTTDEGCGSSRASAKVRPFAQEMVSSKGIPFTPHGFDRNLRMVYEQRAGTRGESLAVRRSGVQRKARDGYWRCGRPSYVERDTRAEGLPNTIPRHLTSSTIVLNPACQAGGTILFHIAAEMTAKSIHIQWLYGQHTLILGKRDRYSLLAAYGSLHDSPLVGPSPPARCLGRVA